MITTRRCYSMMCCQTLRVWNEWNIHSMLVIHDSMDWVWKWTDPPPRQSHPHGRELNARQSTLHQHSDEYHNMWRITRVISGMICHLQQGIQFLALLCRMSSSRPMCRVCLSYTRNDINVLAGFGSCIALVQQIFDAPKSREIFEVFDCTGGSDMSLCIHDEWDAFHAHQHYIYPDNTQV